MLLLTSTSDLIRVVTTTTADLDVHASYVDMASGGTPITAGRKNTAITAATTTTVVDSPAASTARTLKSLTIRNKHATTSNTVTVLHSDGTTVLEAVRATLLAGYALHYSDNAGFCLLDDNGRVLTSPASFFSTPLVVDEQTSVPATPATGLKLWSRNLAGRRHLLVTDPAGESYPLQPHLARTRTGRWNPIGNANNLPLAEGIAAPTSTGTATVRTVATTNLFASLRRLGLVSAATAGSLAGLRLAAAQFWRGNGAGLGGFTFYCRFGTSDAATVSGARMFVGLSASTGAPTNVEPNTINNSVGVGQIAASNNLQIITRDATTAATTDLGASFPASTLSVDVYDLLLFCAPNGSTIGYRVERMNTGDVAEGTLSTNLPVNTTLLGIQLWRTNNATALAVGLDLVHLQIDTDA